MRCVYSGVVQALTRISSASSSALRLLRGHSHGIHRNYTPCHVQADDHASLTEVVDEGRLLGQPDRVMQGHLGLPADANPPGAGGDGRGKGQRIDIGTATVKVMLRQPENVEAQGITEFGLTERLVDDDTIGIRELALRKRKLLNCTVSPSGHH